MEVRRRVRVQQRTAKAESDETSEASRRTGRKIGKKKGPSRLGSAGAHKFSSGRLVHKTPLRKPIPGQEAARKQHSYSRFKGRAAAAQSACQPAPFALQ